MQMFGDYGKEKPFKFFKIFLVPNVFIVMRKEGKEKGRRSNTKKIPKISLYEYIYKKQHIHYLVYGHFPWSTFGLHLVGCPKAFKKHFYKNQT